jgi:hypothetical protein
MLRLHIPASILTGCKAAALVLLFAGSSGMFAQTALAAPPPARDIAASNIPQVGQCGRWSAYLLQTKGAKWA